MPAPPLEFCDLDALKKDAACLMPKCIGPGDTDRLAMEVVVRIAQIAAEGGPDWTTDPTAILPVATQWSVLGENERKAIALWIDFQNAIGEGATFGGDTSVEHLLALAKCWRCYGDVRLKALLLFLKCVVAVEEIAEG